MIGALGATVPGGGIGNGKALTMEVLLTAGLVNTQHRHQRRNRGWWIYCPVGTLGRADHRRLDEPGETFAPDLVRGNFGTTWIYVAGPAIGALIGVAFKCCCGARCAGR
jgi:aquaporin Z